MMKLYKFKSTTDSSLKHCLDMIINKRIYFSRCQNMNDPREGLFNLSNNDFKDNNHYERIKKEVRKIIDNIYFTSFTNSMKNELLWAHYAGGFSGVAFEYDFDESSTPDLKHITYSDDIPIICKNNAELIINNESIKAYEITNILHTKK